MATLKRKSPKNNGGSRNGVYVNLENNKKYNCRLVYVADLGLQERNFKGEAKPPAQQIALGLEVIGESVSLDDGSTVPRLMWTRPFYVYSTMSSKGAEMKYYSVFNPEAEEDTVADWEMVLGVPCKIINKHFKKDDVTYDQIGSLIPVDEDFWDSIGPYTIEPCIGDSEDEENPCTKALFGLVKYMWDKRVVDDEYHGPGLDMYDEPDSEVPF